MASPQVENGYMRIANELSDEFICRDLPGREFRVVWFVMRRTYGFNRKDAPISLSEFSATTDISSRDVVRVIQSLEAKNILSVIRVGSCKSNVYSINKNYESWKSGSGIRASGLQATGKVATSSEASGLQASGTSGLYASGTTGLHATTDGIMISHNNDSERAAEFEKNAKDNFKDNIKDKEEEEEYNTSAIKQEKQQKNASSSSPISPDAQTEIKQQTFIKRNQLVQALGKIQISDAELTLWQALENVGCSLEDLSEARKLKDFNSRLAYLKDVVCECRDRRIAANAKINEKPRLSL